MGLEAPPIYRATLSEESRQADARTFARNDVRTFCAVLGLARQFSVDPTSSTSIQFSAFVGRSVLLTRATATFYPDDISKYRLDGILLEGDIVAGSASLRIEERLIPGSGFGMVSAYTAQAILAE